MITRIILFFSVLFFLSFYGAVLMAVPSADRIFRFGVLACDGTMIAMAVSVIWRNRTFSGVRYLLLFMVISTITLFWNLHSVAVPTHLNGLRQPLFFLSCLIVLHDFSQSPRWAAFEQMFNFFLVVFAILQVPLALVQFLEYGAGDMVGGSYGYMGGSGYLTQLMFLITFYFISRASWAHDADGVRFRAVLLFSLFLLPCTVNETKISFVYLAAFIVLLTLSRRKILRSIPILVLGVALMLVLNYYYGKTAMDTETLFDPQFLERYLVYDPRENVDVPRFQKLVLMFRTMHGDVGSILLGLGYGVFAGENILGTSTFGRSLWYFQGTRMMLQSVWIQGGLLAVLALLPPTFWFFKRYPLQSGNMRRFRAFLVILMASIWLYNEALYSRPFAMIGAFMVIWIGLGGMERSTAEEASSPEQTALQEVR